MAAQHYELVFNDMIHKKQLATRPAKRTQPKPNSAPPARCDFYLILSDRAIGIAFQPAYYEQSRELRMHGW